MQILRVLLSDQLFFNLNRNRKRSSKSTVKSYNNLKNRKLISQFQMISHISN